MNARGKKYKCERVGMGEEKYKLSCKMTCNNRKGKKTQGKKKFSLQHDGYGTEGSGQHEGQVGLNSDGK
jgi:hypothetical protein